MERKPSIAAFVKRTDFMNKLRAKLEDLENGQDLGAFDGLQTEGVAGVLVSFDGNTVNLANAVQMLEDRWRREFEAKMREEAEMREKDEIKKPKFERKKTT